MTDKERFQQMMAENEEKLQQKRRADEARKVEEYKRKEALVATTQENLKKVFDVIEKSLQGTSLRNGDKLTVAQFPADHVSDGEIRVTINDKNGKPKPLAIVTFHGEKEYGVFDSTRRVKRPPMSTVGEVQDSLFDILASLSCEEIDHLKITTLR